MQVNEGSISVIVGLVVITASAMKFLQYMFSKFGKIESHAKDIEDLREGLKKLKDSEIKQISSDIRKIEKDFQDLKQSVQTTIAEGNTNLERTINELHIKLLEKITNLNES